MMLIIYFYDKQQKKNKKILIIILVIVLIAIALLSWQNIYSIFPIMASSIMILAFLLNDENKIRMLGFISNIFWTIYGIIYFSYVTIVFEILSVIGTFIAIKKNKK